MVFGLVNVRWCEITSWSFAGHGRSSGSDTAAGTDAPAATGKACPAGGLPLSPLLPEGSLHQGLPSGMLGVQVQHEYLKLVIM